MAEESRGKLLLLEDDEGMTHLVRLRLERLGYTVVSATTVEEALRRAELRDVDLVVLDYRLRGDLSGLDFHRRLQAAGHDVPAILVTGFSDEQKLIEAIRAGVRDFVPKTTDFLDYLPTAIERVMDQIRTHRQAAESEAMRESNAELERLIAERRRLEEELRASNEQLREADRRKDEFLAMLAHEFRNPLNTLGNCVRLLHGDDPEDRAWSEDVLDRQVHYLNRLIDDLLDISRISRGKIELRKEPMELRAIAEHASRSVRALMEGRRHTLTLALDDDPLFIEADPTRIEQIVTNLLFNAAKYTDPGGQITLRTWAEGTKAVLAIEDNGLGLTPEMLARIFDLFAQVDHSLARSQGGLGIGLTLVKQLAELHGGEVEGRSAGLGQGSEFLVRLPRLTEPARKPAIAPASAPPAAKGSARILVIDDNEDAARALHRLLKSSGHEARVAYDGPSAIVAAEEFRPEIVLLDIGLPGMDGFAVARALRQRPDAEPIVLIGISGYAPEVHGQTPREAGFDHYLVKPFDFKALLELLRNPATADSGMVSVQESP